tara:strand:- start:196 stop:672 length:477 start_codon:yes stop_codon:yes gene_type:complete
MGTSWNPFSRDEEEARKDALKGSAGGAGDYAMIKSLQRADAAAKPVTDAQVLQTADPALTAAGAVGQTAGMEVAQQGLGLGGGPIQVGRSHALAAQLGFDPNAASKALTDARALETQIQEQRYNTEMTRMLSQAQFDKAQSNAMISKLLPDLSVSIPV